MRTSYLTRQNATVAVKRILMAERQLFLISANKSRLGHSSFESPGNPLQGLMTTKGPLEAKSCTSFGAGSTKTVAPCYCERIPGGNHALGSSMMRSVEDAYEDIEKRSQEVHPRLTDAARSDHRSAQSNHRRGATAE